MNENELPTLHLLDDNHQEIAPNAKRETGSVPAVDAKSGADLPQTGGDSNLQENVAIGTAQMGEPPHHVGGHSSSSSARNDTNINRIISHRYVVEARIGAGAFGTIYRGKDLITGLRVAVKIEPRSMKHPQLEYEAKVYQMLAGSRIILRRLSFGVFFHILFLANFPNFHYFVQEENDSILIIDLLGPSLEDLFNYCGRKFSLKTVVLLADQMVFHGKSLFQYL